MTWSNPISGFVTTLKALESGLLDMKDFYFTGDDYRYKLEVEAKRRLLQFLKAKFNSGVEYKGKTWKWDTIILNKVQELGMFLLGKSESINFTDPAPKLRREDSRGLRKRILELTVNRARELGISKSTLCVLRQRAQAVESFRIYRKVRLKLGSESKDNQDSES